MTDDLETVLADSEEYVSLLLEDVARERARAEAAEAALAELRAAARAALAGLNDSPNDMAQACERCMRLALRQRRGVSYCDNCEAHDAYDLEYAAAIRALLALLPPAGEGVRGG